MYEEKEEFHHKNNENNDMQYYVEYCPGKSALANYDGGSIINMWPMSFQCIAAANALQKAS